MTGRSAAGSTLADLLPLAVQAVCQYKTRSVRRAGGDRPVLLAVECWRGAEQVAAVLVPPTGDQALPAIGTAAVGFAADTLAVGADTWMATGEDNPVTGRPWQPGELGEVVQRHHGVAKGWVVEAMNVIAVNRAGDVVSMSCPYTVTGRRVEWGEQQQVQPGDEGLIRELVRVMTLPVPDAAMHRAGIHVTGGADRLRDQLDCATVRAMQAQRLTAGVLLYATPGSPRHQTIRRLLPGGQTIRPHRKG